jgi:hypothetical protein
LRSRKRDETRLVPVKRRRIIHISGFEPIEPAVLTRRLSSGLKHFAPIWGATATRSDAVMSEDGRVISWDVTAHGPNWSTATQYTILRWDDLMAPYVGQPWLRRIVAGYAALFEFARTGTITRYFKANVRYGLFVIYPVLVLAACLILAAVAGGLALLAEIPFAALSAPLLALLVFVLLMRVLGNFFYLDFALSDWSFAADLARREVAGFEQCLARFADVVGASVRSAEADEILVSGVSLGAVMMVEALARAFAEDPDFCRRNERVAFLTVGSSLLKIGLHPAAMELKSAVARVASESSLFWVEYQAKVDLINFYKTDPVAGMGLPATGKPLVRNVRIREMMSPEDYRRGQRNPLYLHRQFVMPNGRRYFYDFYQICFGPLALADRVAIGDRAASTFAKDGSFPRARSTKRQGALVPGQ